MKHVFALLTFLSFITQLLLAQDDNYQLIWADEFDAPTLNTNNWNYELGGHGWGNQELQYYSDRTDNVRIENGKLIIEAKKEIYPPESAYPNAYTSGRITTKNKVKTCYGKIEARISLPAGAGTWPAFWMMPNDNAYGSWPRSGEIDIMEHVGYDPDMISFAVHTYNKNGSRGNNWHSQITNNTVENNFHTYAIEWLDDRIAFYFDGQKQITLWRNFTDDYKGWPFDKDFFVIFNLALGGKMGGTVNDAIFNSPVKMEVDYVRIYQKKATAIHQNSNNLSALPVPNPFDDYLTITDTDATSCQLIDTRGIVAASDNVFPGQPINTAHLHKGIYLLKIVKEGHSVTHRVIKK